MDRVRLHVSAGMNPGTVHAARLGFEKMDYDSGQLNRTGADPRIDWTKVVDFAINLVLVHGIAGKSNHQHRERCDARRRCTAKRNGVVRSASQPAAGDTTVVSARSAPHPHRFANDWLARYAGTRDDLEHRHTKMPMPFPIPNGISTLPTPIGRLAPCASTSRVQAA